MQNTINNDTLTNSLRIIKAVIARIETFLNKVSQLIMRGIGLIFCIGGLLATVGWLLAVINTNPLSSTWSVAVWLVMIGVLLLILAMQALAFQYVLRLGMIGQYGLLIFLVGALVVVAGACAVDLFILPWMFKVASQIPDLSGQLQSAYNSVQSGTNTTVNSVANAGSSACNSVTSGLSSGLSSLGGGNISSSCSTSAASNPVPGQTVPSLSLNSLLASIGLPSIASLGSLGLVFLSGVFLAPGCLIMSVIFLAIGVKPRSALLLIIVSAFLNLVGQFALHVPFLGPVLGMLLFLSLAWLGFALWFSGKFSLFGTRLSVASNPTSVS